MLKIIKSERSEKHEKTQSMLKRVRYEKQLPVQEMKNTHTQQLETKTKQKNPIRHKLDLENRYEEINQNGDMRLKLYKSN